MPPWPARGLLKSFFSTSYNYGPIWHTTASCHPPVVFGHYSHHPESKKAGATSLSPIVPTPVGVQFQRLSRPERRRTLSVNGPGGQVRLPRHSPPGAPPPSLVQLRTPSL